MARSTYKGYTIDIRSNDCRKVGSPWALYSAAFLVKAVGKSTPPVRRTLQGQFHTAQFAIRAGTDSAKHFVEELIWEQTSASAISSNTGVSQGPDKVARRSTDRVRGVERATRANLGPASGARGRILECDVHLR